MDEISMSADADGQGDSRQLEYEWRILSDGSGMASLANSGMRSAFLRVRWASEATAGSLVGRSVEVELQVRFNGATESDLPAFQTQTVRISGVNRPPVPVITGTLGSSSERIPAGRAVRLTSFDSTDPDGDAFRADWGWGTSRGGRYLRPPVMYGSEGSIASFTVPDMTSPVDQEVFLILQDGLHEVRSSAFVYLKPAETAPPPTSSGNPSLTVVTPTVTAVRGQNAILQVTAADADGDDLNFSWVFLQTGTTAGPSYVSSRRTSASSWLSTLTYPTIGLNPGSYSFSVQAKESGKTSPISSEKKFLTLVVENSQGGGSINEDQQVCGVNTGPALVRLSPDPRYSRVVLRKGQSSTIEALFRDSSEVTSVLGGSRKGVDTIKWGSEALGQLGIDARSNVSSTLDPFEARSILTLTAGQTAPSTARVTVVAADVQGCSNTVSFDVAVEQSDTNEKPVSRLRYNAGAGTKSVTDGSNVEVTSGQVELDAGASTDDGATASLRYSWAIAGQATLSSVSGVKNTLTIPETTDGPITVTLTVTDAGGLSSSMTVAFKLATANESPVAAVKFDTEGLGSFSGPFKENQSIDVSAGTIQLDASGTTDDGGTAALQYHWSITGVEGAVLSSDSGLRTTLTLPENAAGSVTVVLTVTDGPGANDQVQVTFGIAQTAAVPTALITSIPATVEAGEELAVEADARGGSQAGEYRYAWTATAAGGKPVEIYSTGSRARLFAPALERLEPETLTVGLTVYKDGVASEPVLAEVTVTGPSLYFSQLAVGMIDDAREFQTCVVLVNNTDVTAQGRITLINNDFGTSWAVQVDGEYQSEFPVSIGPGGAVKYVLSGDQVEIGWLSLESNVRLTGHLFYQVVDRESRRALREVPILPTTGRGFRTALDVGQNNNLALALVNLGQDEIRFRLVVQSTLGGSMETQEMVLGPQQHLARFLSEFFDDGASGAAIPASFGGGTLMIQISGGSGELAATIMKTDEGLPLSILPVGTW